MNEHHILGYSPNDTIIHRMNGASKLFFVLLVSIACMTTYDTRFLMAISIFSIVLFKIARIKWYQISFVMSFIFFFSILNLIAVFVFQPSYGSQLYGTQHILFGHGWFTVTQEELFYLLNIALKYFCSIPLMLGFILTTNPSEFAASLNKLGISYKISYSVSLALRYIPDVQNDFFSISQAQQARGYEMSRKGSLLKRIKGALQIVFPLVFSSLDRIETISTAMELRRFGKNKKRTWYVEKPFKRFDYFSMALALILFLMTLYLFKVNNGRFFNIFK